MPSARHGVAGLLCAASAGMQELFVHEMTHVWQAQRGGRWYLPLVRHPFCRYHYRLVPGKGFARYGVEQQAEIVRDVFVARRAGAPWPALEALLPFRSTPLRNGEEFLTQVVRPER